MISNAVLLDWVKADAADTTLLRTLEQAAIKHVEQLTGRYWGVTANITDVIQYRSWPFALSNTPTSGSLSSLAQWDGSAYVTIPATDYYVNGSLVYANATFQWPQNPLLNPLSYRFRAIYAAGYTVDAGDANVWAAPKDVQAAVLLLVGHWYENRESVIVGTSAVEVPLTVQAILAPHTRVAV